MEQLQAFVAQQLACEEANAHLASSIQAAQDTLALLHGTHLSMREERQCKPPCAHTLSMGNSPRGEELPTANSNILHADPDTHQLMASHEGTFIPNETRAQYEAPTQRTNSKRTIRGGTPHQGVKARVPDQAWEACICEVAQCQTDRGTEIQCWSTSIAAASGDPGCEGGSLNGHRPCLSRLERHIAAAAGSGKARPVQGGPA